MQIKDSSDQRFCFFIFIGNPSLFFSLSITTGMWTKQIWGIRPPMTISIHLGVWVMARRFNNWLAAPSKMGIWWVHKQALLILLIRRNEMIQTDFHTISVVGNWWSINRWRLLSFGFTRRPQVLSVARHLRIPSDWKKLTHHLDLNKAGHLRRIRSYCTHEGLC